jgi:hypothetical protein
MNVHRRAPILLRAPVACLVLWSMGLGAANAPAQETADAPTATAPRHPLPTKQEMLRERYRRFEDRMFRLREKLLDTEPENAARLAEALQRAGELGLADRLDELVRLLSDATTLREGVDAQQRWVAEAERVLNVLLERDGNNEDRRRRIEQVEEVRRALEDLLGQQRAHHEAAARAAAARRLRQDLESARQRLEALRQAQGDAGEQFERTPPSTDTERAEWSRQQGQRAEQAESLGKDLRDAADSPPAPNAESPPAPNTEDAGQNEAQSQAAEAAKSLNQASRAMRQAERAAGEQRDDQSRAAQREAEEALERARERLQRAIDRLQKKQEESPSGEAQRSTADQARELGSQMQPGESPQGTPSPNDGSAEAMERSRSQLEQAEREMRDAAEELDRERPEDAEAPQQRALQRLDEARLELEDELNQLRSEDRGQTLRDLEARFRDMYHKQQEIQGETVALHEVGREQFRRPEELKLADLSTRQRTLAERAATCLHILEEEGTTIVFPHMVEQVAQDMGTVADLLAERQVGPVTQGIEQEILDALEQIIEATQRMQQENQNRQQMQPQNSQDETSPLLPPSAELKLLRASQVRVNTRTTSLEQSRSTGDLSPESLRSLLDAVARRQAECADIAGQIRTREEGP